MKIPIISFVALCVAGTAFHYVRAVPPAHVVLVTDLSLSTTKNCSGLESVARSITEADGIQKGSTLTVLHMGSGVNDPEPRQVIDQDIPIADTVYGQKEVKGQREALFSKVRTDCEAAPSTKRSPIVRSVMRAVEHLHARGCVAKSACKLVLRTDGEEDVDPVLSRVIARASKSPYVEIPSEIAGRFDNAGIAVIFCGLAETRAKPQGSTASSPETLQRIWTSVFSHPETVAFQPFCGTADEHGKSDVKKSKD